MLTKNFTHVNAANQPADYTGIEIYKPEVWARGGTPVPGGLADPRMGPSIGALECKTCAGQEKTCSGHFGFIKLAEPVFNPLWAWLVANELPPIWTFIGGTVILAAIVMQALFAATSEKRHARRHRTA